MNFRHPHCCVPPPLDTETEAQTSKSIISNSIEDTLTFPKKTPKYVLFLFFTFRFLSTLENASQKKFTYSNNCQRDFREAPSWSMEFYFCWSAPFIPRNSNCGSYLRACAGGVFFVGDACWGGKGHRILIEFNGGKVWRWGKVEKSFFLIWGGERW